MTPVEATLRSRAASQEHFSPRTFAATAGLSHTAARRVLVRLTAKNLAVRVGRGDFRLVVDVKDLPVEKLMEEAGVAKPPTVPAASPGLPRAVLTKLRQRADTQDTFVAATFAAETGLSSRAAKRVLGRLVV